MLGGTRFIGLHMTALALQRGHTLTFFNRGKTKADRYPEVERIKGDRNGQIDGLKDREWDVVIDNSGYVPRHVRLSAELLAPKVRQYVFTSSISVYPDFSVPRDEKSPVGKLADETIEKVDGETYGPLKALCEQAAEKALPGRTTIIRPGLIVGPDDNTDRFTWWPARAARGGEFIAPGAAAGSIPGDRCARPRRVHHQRHREEHHRHVQPGLEREWLQVRRTHRCVDRLGQQARVAGRHATRHLDPADFLAAQEVAPWSEMPVWLPAKGEEAAFAGTSNAAAVARGLTITPLAKTVDDTMAWHLTRPAEEREKLKAGIAPDKEARVLAAWKARPGG